MLYDELEIAVGVLISMVNQGQRVSATDPAHRARSILIGLDVGLDRDAGGDVAGSLSRVYRSMRRKLDDSVAANSAAGLDRKSVGQGKRGSVRVGPGGRSAIKKKKTEKYDINVARSQ